MSRARRLFTTSEYLGALTLTKTSGASYYRCNGKEFALFSTAAAAEKDAQWLVDFYKKEGTRKRKPTVYRIRLEAP